MQRRHCSLGCDAAVCECPPLGDQCHQASSDPSASWKEQLQYCTQVHPGAPCCSHHQPLRIKQKIPELHRVAADGLIHLVRQLGARGQLEYRAPQMAGATALHVAAQCGQPHAVRALIELGAGVDLPSDNGSTPLYMACLYCRAEAIKALLELGSDPNCPAEDGSTSIDVACPKIEQLLTQWQRFSPPQRGAVRMHGWGYLSLPRWTRSGHLGFPELFQKQVTTIMLSLHTSGYLVGGARELTALIASAVDVTNRALEDSLGNRYFVNAKDVSSKRKHSYSFQSQRKAYRGWSKNKSL